MTGRTTFVLGMFGAALSGGCGTLDNIQRPALPPLDTPNAPVCRVYGGLRGEWATISDFPKSSIASPIDYVVIPVLATGDLLATLIGDTVTLPYTLVAEGRRAFGGTRPAPDTSPVSAPEPVPAQSTPPK